MKYVFRIIIFIISTASLILFAQNEELFFKVKIKGYNGSEQTAYRVKKGEFLYIENYPLIPFIYRGGNPVNWGIESEGKIIINRRVAGFILEEKNLPYLKEYRDAEFVVFADKNSFPKSITSFIYDNLYRKIYLSLQGYCGEGDDLSNLSRINDRIIFLSLRDSKLTKLTKDLGLTYLNGLDLYNSKLPESDIIKLIGNNTIVRLNIGKTSISTKGFIQLTNLSVLKHLDISWTNLGIRELEFLKLFQNLESLNLSGTKIDDDFLENLQSMITLQDLSLKDTNISDKGVYYLKDLNFIKRLDLSGLRFGENPSGLAALEHLSRLQILILRKAVVNKTVLDYVSRCQLLRVLDITNSNVGNVDLSRLGELYSLQELYCGENPLTGDGLKYIKNIPALKLLDATATHIGGEEQQYLKYLTEIETLYLAGTEFDDFGMASIEDLPKLVELDAGNTLVTKKSIECILKMPSIRRVYLNGSKYTPKDIEALKKASPLLEVYY